MKRKITDLKHQIIDLSQQKSDKFSEHERQNYNSQENQKKNTLVRNLLIIMYVDRKNRSKICLTDIKSSELTFD